MLSQGFEGYVYLVLLMITIVVATIVIPCYGYARKGLNGLGLGCALQPFVALLLCLLLVMGAYLRWERIIGRNRNATMVAVRTTTVEKGDTLVRTWRLKPDEECMCEMRSLETDSTDYDDVEFFDAVPTDSFTLSVDDHIVVRFDLDPRRATATDCDQPIDVVSVDWEKVEAYFNEKEERE